MYYIERYTLIISILIDIFFDINYHVGLIEEKLLLNTIKNVYYIQKKE